MVCTLYLTDCSPIVIDTNGKIYPLSLYSYTEARKDREKFRKKLTEVIMHRDEWDDEDAEPGMYKVHVF